MARSDEGTAILGRLHHAQGASAYHLELFGDQLAKREGYKEHDGLDAIRYYLMLEHGWLPREVRAMSVDDLQFATAELFSGWTTPKASHDAYPGF